MKKILLAASLLIGFAGIGQNDSTKKKNNGYAMVGFAFNSSHSGGFGGTIGAGFKGSKKAPAIGIGIDVIKFVDLSAVYLPMNGFMHIWIVSDIFQKWIARFFKKYFFVNMRVGYVPYNTGSSTDRSHTVYKGGFYAGLGVGATLPTKGRVAPFISVLGARMP